jgi:hypothetical protein
MLPLWELLRGHAFANHKARGFRYCVLYCKKQHKSLQSGMGTTVCKRDVEAGKHD